MLLGTPECWCRAGDQVAEVVVALADEDDVDEEVLPEDAVRREPPEDALPRERSSWTLTALDDEEAAAATVPSVEYGEHGLDDDVPPPRLLVAPSRANFPASRAGDADDDDEEDGSALCFVPLCCVSWRWWSRCAAAAA